MRHLPLTPSAAAGLYWAGRGGKVHSLLVEHAERMMGADHREIRVNEMAERLMAFTTDESGRYPRKLAVDPSGNQITLDYIRHFEPRRIAEIGIYEGDTAIQIAKMMSAWSGVLHVYDFHDRVDAFMNRVDREAESSSVLGMGNSYKYQDSYNWNLAAALADEVGYDYVFIDGAHTWNVDALTFLLVDRMLNPGGIIDFDDYHWTVAGSPSLNPGTFPLSAELMTEEQMTTKQVKMVVDLLVKRDPRYVELFPNKIFRKVG